MQSDRDKKNTGKEEEKTSDKKGIFTPSAKSPIQVALDNIASIDHVTVEKTEEKPIQGGFNQITFAKMIGPRLTNSRGTSIPSDVAIIKDHRDPSRTSKDTPEKREERLLKRKEAYDLIKNINSPYLQKFLYFTPDQRIALKAERDFYEWIYGSCADSEYRFEPAEKVDVGYFKALVAMMIQAVNVLHINNCVHLDIKLDNFLVYLIDNRMCLVLIDMDDVTHVDEADKELHSIKMVSYYASPEFASAFEVSRTVTCLPASLKPHDVYCLGRTIAAALELFIPADVKATPEERRKILRMYGNIIGFGQIAEEEEEEDQDECDTLINFIVYVARTQSPELHELLNLICYLLHSDVRQRWNVGKAMDSPFFGATPTERHDYFRILNEDAAATLQLTINGEPLTNPRMDSAFWLLDPKIKAIYQAAKTIDNKIKLFNYRPTVWGRSPSVRRTLVNELEKEVEALTQKIEASVPTEKREPFKTLVRVINDEIKRVRDKIESSLAEASLSTPATSAGQATATSAGQALTLPSLGREMNSIK